MGKKSLVLASLVTAGALAYLSYHSIMDSPDYLPAQQRSHSMQPKRVELRKRAQASSLEDTFTQVIEDPAAEKERLLIDDIAKDLEGVESLRKQFKNEKAQTEIEHKRITAFAEKYIRDHYGVEFEGKDIGLIQVVGDVYQMSLAAGSKIEGFPLERLTEVALRTYRLDKDLTAAWKDSHPLQGGFEIVQRLSSYHRELDQKVEAGELDKQKAGILILDRYKELSHEFNEGREKAKTRFNSEHFVQEYRAKQEIARSFLGGVLPQDGLDALLQDMRKGELGHSKLFEERFPDEKAKDIPPIDVVPYLR